MQATWNDHIIAEADKKDLVYVERNWYFPPSSVKWDYLDESDTPYICPWRGKGQYYNVVGDGKTGADNAWAYPELPESAIKRVHKDFTSYVAFGGDVTVVDD